MRGSPPEVSFQPPGLQLWTTRGAGGQDPPLVQFCPLAPTGGGTSQAAIRARPARCVRQGRTGRPRLGEK